MTYNEWCREKNCDHAHCPDGCEKPQPFDFDGCGRLVCGRCWFRFGEVVEVVPCTPEICKED